MSALKYFKERESVALYMKRLYERGLTTASGGNISLRINKELFCITPSSLDKANLTPEVIALVTLDGKNLTPDLPLSIETEMHRKIYCERPDRSAIVHSHPTYACAFATAQPCCLNTRLSAEAYLMLGDIINIPYALMGTEELASVVSASMKEKDVALMENHGALALGKNLLRAFDCIDLLERAARMTLAVQNIPHSKALSEQQIRAIDAMRG